MRKKIAEADIIRNFERLTTEDIERRYASEGEYYLCVLTEELSVYCKNRSDLICGISAVILFLLYLLSGSYIAARVFPTFYSANIPVISAICRVIGAIYYSPAVGKLIILLLGFLPIYLISRKINDFVEDIFLYLYWLIAFYGGFYLILSLHLFSLSSKILAYLALLFLFCMILRFTFELTEMTVAHIEYKYDEHRKSIRFLTAIRKSARFVPLLKQELMEQRNYEVEQKEKEIIEKYGTCFYRFEEEALKEEITNCNAQINAKYQLIEKLLFENFDSYEQK